MAHFSTDREILETAIEWLQQGQQPALVTVVKTWGSSPRPVGSLMLMRKDGIHHGSVSGGCVEEDLVASYCSNRLSNDWPVLVDYGIDRDDASRFGLPCGGRLELCVEQLDSAQQLKILLNKLQHGELVSRRLRLSTGEASLHPASMEEDFVYSKDIINKVYGPKWQMLLIGACHLSQYVAQMALMLDYKVIVCDPREVSRRAWTVAGTQLVSIMPDDAVSTYANHRRSAVIALTHDPKLDDMALLAALSANVFYVGALGSRRNNQKRRQRLKTLGLTPQQLNKLHAPVGLPIGSHTAPEIAVSILAEITLLRDELKAVAKDSVSAA